MSCSATYTMYIHGCIFWRVELDYPVDAREVQASGRDIRSEHASMLSPTKVLVNQCSSVLFNLSVQCRQRYARLHALKISKTNLHCEQVLKKNHNFVLLVAFDEGI